MKRFDYESKIARFISRSIVNIIREQQGNENLKHSVRVSLLINQPIIEGERRFAKRRESIKSCAENIRVKPMTYVAFFVPSSIKAFEKPKKEKETVKRFSRNSTLRLTNMFKRSQGSANSFKVK